MALGAYQTNTYLVWGENSQTCVVIDPGYQPEKILSQVEKEGKKVEAVLLTHGHFDHVGGVRRIAEETGCVVYMHPEERSLPGELTAGELYPSRDYDGEVTAGGLIFGVLHTPGHTPGSVCLVCDSVIFSGDTLFAGSMGRTDFPGGDLSAMGKSLKRLRELPGDYQVFPGHGEDTTLSHERETNPYLRGVL